MTYTDRFALVDGLVAHLDTVVVPAMDPFLRTRYVGFLCVSTVTVIELAIRDILIGFATKKHRVFGVFCEDMYERLNGRIMIKDLRENHIRRFGTRYVEKFTNLVNVEESRELATSGRSVVSSYGNLITWRHAFSHQGLLPANASYDGAKVGFDLAKLVLSCLDKSMAR